MMGLSVLIVTLVLPKQARFRFEYEKGKIWMQKDLVSPYSFAIKKTNAEIEADRQDILKSVLPVYRNSEDVVLRSLENFNTEFETKWPTSGINDKEKSKYQTYGTRLLKEVYQRGVISAVKKY